MKKILFAILLLAALPCQAWNSVAIVADKATYAACKPSVERYAAAIGRYDGKDALVLVADWTPERLRDTLKYLHGRRKLEGAVLVGNIPVPMIRRAHHLCTAFKMDPKYPVKRSSVPSDRFYDDFGLQFRFINRDGDLWYYDLMPEGAQRVRCDIYTARVKPSRKDPEHSFEDLVCEFLDRAAEAKTTRDPLDRVFHFGGHGNSSESFNARIDEERAYYEQFGLKEPSGPVMVPLDVPFSTMLVPIIGPALSLTVPLIPTWAMRGSPVSRNSTKAMSLLFIMWLMNWLDG